MAVAPADAPAMSRIKGFVSLMQQRHEKSNKTFDGGCNWAEEKLGGGALEKKERGGGAINVCDEMDVTRETTC